MHQSERLSEIDRYVAAATQSAQEILFADNAHALRDAWESFLSNFARAIGRLISAGKENPASTAWAHRLQNSSKKDDEGLVYLREARNVVEHGLEPFALFSDPFVAVAGGAFVVAGNSSVHIENCAVNGIPTGTFTLETKQGRLERLDGEPNVTVRQTPASVRLVPVKNPEKRTHVFAVPSQVMGVPVEPSDPLSLAIATSSILARLRSDLALLWSVK